VKFGENHSTNKSRDRVVVKAPKGQGGGTAHWGRQKKRKAPGPRSLLQLMTQKNPEKKGRGWVKKEKNQTTTPNRVKGETKSAKVPQKGVLATTN